MKKFLIQIAYYTLAGLAASTVIANGMLIHDMALIKADESCKKKRRKELERKIRQEKAD